MVSFVKSYQVLHMCLSQSVPSVLALFTKKCKR